MRLRHGFERDIEQLLTAAVAAGDVPGAVAAITDTHDVVFAAARGLASHGDARPMQADAMVWIASMTKPLVSAAALQLVERGVVALDEPLAARVPGLGEARVLSGFDGAGQPQTRAPARPVTLRHLLTHTSGFGYEYWNADVQRVQKALALPGIGTCRDDALRLPLLFDPGERWEYGIGIDWTGKVIEALSGLPLGRFLHENLLGPLDMRDTVFRLRPDQLARRASVHRRNADGSWRSTQIQVPQDAEYESGGHGLYGAADDYLRFLRMILNDGRGPQGTVLSPASIASMTSGGSAAPEVRRLATVQAGAAADLDLLPGVPAQFTNGFLVTTAPAPSGLPRGSLAWAGLANTYFWIDRASRVGAVLLAQSLPFGERRAQGLFQRLQQAVYGPAPA